jgi:predicted DNA-binding transcriptional regulator YafY
MYRVSRVEQADVLEEAAERPDGLDVRAEWQRLRSGLEQQAPVGVDVLVRVRPERVEMVRRIATPMLAKGEVARDVPSDDEWPHLRMHFRVQEAACGVLLGFAGDVEVLEPAGIRARMLQLAEAAVATYG